MPPAFDPTSLRARLLAKQGPRYWRSLEELAGAPEFESWLHREFPAGASEWLEGFSRRHFLKLMGASLALAGLTACTKQPIEKIVPYIHQPEILTPGQPLFYATSMVLGGFATGLLVESHEGHPTKVEGNPQHPMSLGATNVFQQASLLDLYDPDRSQAVLKEGNISSWEAFLAALNDTLLAQQPRKGAGLRVLTETVTSPTLQAQIRAVLEKFPEARWHQFEPLTRDAVRAGAQLAFGEIVETQCDVPKAKVILALESDFLFMHPASLRYGREFADGRRVSAGRNEMNRLYVAESTPSVTGANADHRLPLSARLIELLAREVARQVGALPGNAPAPELQVHQKWISVLAGDLKQNRGASLILVGEQQPPAVHALAHLLNHHLGNVGSTVRYTASAEARSVNQLESFRELVTAMKAGAVEVLVMVGGNPAFTAPADLDFTAQLSKVPFRVHLSPDLNETSALCQWHVPQTHFLESWSDPRAFDGTVSFIQPLILPLYAGKSDHELLDAMLQQPVRSNFDIVRDYWKSRNLWPDFEAGWRRALHDGFIAGTALPSATVALRPLELPPPKATVPGGLEISFRPDPTIGDGRFANNGWLQELPKPMTKLTWDNAALLSPATAQRLGLASGAEVLVQWQGRSLRAPVWITPGQAENSVTFYLGYGRQQVGRVGTGAGCNAYALRASAAPWFGSGASLTKTGRHHALATTQHQHAIDSAERQILREGTLAEFLRDPAFVKQTTELPKREDTLFNPDEHRRDAPQWGMSIDLSACLGCNACVLACQSENNIPVVGKDQVARGRAMHWIRVDAYFSGPPDDPTVTHQPVPCMQCENAPCELVCPVGATLHDKEGLNMQVYNRCVGTRYCSNNCPYKVRRFNFFQYSDDTTPSLKPMRNPSVTVRSRGVMEKCTYCVQRISAARITAKKEDRPIRDGEIQTACQQVCPAQAIVFGDQSDPNSRVSKLKAQALDYSMLGELNTRPHTTYLAKLRNPHPDLEEPTRAPEPNSPRALEKPPRRKGLPLIEGVPKIQADSKLPHA
jgi:MoCo/4Fe-4S cofactor protein with predicted Tat translocation signal